MFYYIMIPICVFLVYQIIYLLIQRKKDKKANAARRAQQKADTQLLLDLLEEAKRR